MAEDGAGSVVNQIRKYTEFARRVLRRWWLIATLSIIATAGSIALAMTMTRIYESRTLITWKQGVNAARVFSQEDSERHAENWLSPRVAQLIASHTRLWKMAQDIGLYDSERKWLAAEVVLEMLRKAIKFETVGTDSFWITFEYKDPRKAQAGAARLANDFVQQNTGDRLKEALETQTFLETEEQKAKQQLEAGERQLAQFVTDHPEFNTDPSTGQPRGLTNPRSTTGSSLARIARVANPDLRRALLRKAQLEGQLQIADRPQADPRLAQAKQDLAGAQRSFDSLRRKYTPEHPDVQRAGGYVKQMTAALRAAQDSSGGDSKAATSRMRDELVELEAKIKRLQATTTVVRPHEATPSPKPKPEEDAQRGMTQTARLETTWYELTRERQIRKGRYDQIYERLTRARLNASMEKQRVDTQFAIVDAANLPGKPVRPSRSKLVIAGAALGLLLGCALAALLVLLDPRVYNEDDLRKVCDLPVLANIPKEA